MHRGFLALTLAVVVGLAAGCGPAESPDVRRGNLFFKNKQFDAAFQAYEQALAKDPKLLDTVRQNLKKSYYYYGGQLEMGDSLEGAMKYYGKGFALEPTDAGICAKLAKYYWEGKNFELAANYFNRQVELDGELPDTDNKWALMGQDYYTLGYSQFQNRKYQEAIDAFTNSLKISPKGAYAAKAKDALEAAKDKLKK
jgi:tetratricopeptide (TPR) repeat protein